METNLIPIVDEHRPKPVYCAQTLATQYGHLLYFTPPSQQTLQPIELIWAQVKGPIARSPATNATETVVKVRAGLDAMEGRWLDVLRHVPGVEDSFVEAAQRVDTTIS
jgi:hypothetical protein